MSKRCMLPGLGRCAQCSGDAVCDGGCAEAARQAAGGLALYEQALHTNQDLGDVREVAVTQHAMADVLRQQGKPQQAMALYEQVLHVYQDLGDVRSVAVTQLPWPMCW